MRALPCAPPSCFANPIPIRDPTTFVLEAHDADVAPEPLLADEVALFEAVERRPVRRRLATTATNPEVGKPATGAGATAAPGGPGRAARAQCSGAPALGRRRARQSAGAAGAAGAASARTGGARHREQQES